jgi:peroxiredoxin
MLRLTAWSRLEGTIDHARIGAKDVEITLAALEQGSQDEPSIYWVFDRIAPTGATFAYDFLPAIPLAIGRDCRYEKDNATFLQPEPGRTYKVAIGAPGRTVTGRIVCPAQVLKDKSIELTDPRQTHAAAFRLDRTDDAPAGIDAIAENSFAWLRRDKEHVYGPSQTVRKRFIPRIAEDGRFTFPGLEPGEYEFVVNLHAPLGKNVSCGRGVLAAVAVARFTVPQEQGKRPLEVPNVVVELLTYPGVGERAPQFEAKTFDGKTFRLEDLRDKVVLLDFWATWCDPCVAQLPEMQALCEQFADNERFTMISLSVDSDAEKARRLVVERQLRWPQACLGAMDEAPAAQQYGIGEIPMTVLIDSEGKIIARGADMKTLKQEIERALETVR